MGACSSKPKTTEFEESTEPVKKTEDVGADRSIDAVDASQVSHHNEPGKEDQVAADAGAEAMPETRSLIASKDEEPLIKELLSTAEVVSYSVKAESSAAVGEACESAAEKVIADVGDAQKVGATDYKEVSEKATPVGDGVGGYQDKLFEDKAVVLDEASNGVVGKRDAYIDKAVAADEEKAHESSDKVSGSVTVQDEKSRNLQDIKAPGVESPIIGVVHFAEPIHVDDVSESVGSIMPENMTHVDSKVSESPGEIERDVLTGPYIGENGAPSTEKAAYLSSVSPENAPEEKKEVLHDCLPQEAPEEKEEVLHDGSPQEASEEKEEVLHDGFKGSPLLVGVSDGVGQESGFNDAGCKDVPLAPADAQDKTSVEDATKPETAESTSERQEESPLEESARESHAEVTENEGNAEVLEPEAPKVHESIEPKAETTLEQAIEGQVVDEPKASEVQPQALAMEETAEDGKPEATPDEAIAEPSAENDREEKVEKPYIEEATTNELKVESMDAVIVEPSADTDREEKVEKPHIEEVTTNELKVESVDAAIAEPSAETDRGEKVEKPLIEEATTNDLSVDAAIAEPSAETDREEKVEKPHIEEATTNELKVESADAGNLESPVEQVIKALGDGDLAFEDASDVPLKVETSTMESGDKPNS